ncbi:MAG: hypothetical protein ACLP50_00900 [Solirubrobacteraceae bacterium]
MRFTIIIIISLLATALGLAACGSSSSSGTAANASAGQRSDASSRTLEFASCMRSHGVSNFPDPTAGRLPLQIQQTPNSTTVNGVEVNGPAFQSAMRACRSYMPNAGTPSAAQTATAKSQALAMSRCMRSHGVPNFPDPTIQTGPYGGLAFSVDFGDTGIDPNSPAFQAAQQDCGSLIGAPKTAPAG